MGKIIRTVVIGLLLLIFAGSVVTIVRTTLISQAEAQLYERSAEQFVTVKPTETVLQESAGPAGAQPSQAQETTAPIQVDFAALQTENPQVVGWIYCEDTVINYPVLQGNDNSYYLSHAYDGTESSNGSIFVEAENAVGFADANTIIYGHNMKNRTMFGTLEDWARQDYYEAHPVLWLLTPEQDYRLVLFSGYTTWGGSEVYTLFPAYGAELEAYLQAAVQKSDFAASVALPSDGHYVLLSTCAYAFQNARYVLHGVLEPVEKTAGAVSPAAQTAKGG